jgi:hypothetical protein
MSLILRPIPDWPGYEIDRNGNVFSWKQRAHFGWNGSEPGCHELVGSVRKDGRRYVTLTRDGISKSVRVTKLIYQVWHDMNPLIEEKAAARLYRMIPPQERKLMDEEVKKREAAGPPNEERIYKENQT